MSAWLDGPIAGPLVDGDLCEVESRPIAPGLPGWRCDGEAVAIAETITGEHFLLCEYHAGRHGLVAVAA